MKKVFISALVICLICSADAFAAPAVSAHAWAVCDGQNGHIICGSNENAVLPMASTTKIMTALIACEEYSMDEVITVTPECYAEGSSMYLKAGEKVTVRDLLYGLMLMSGNDAARALALHFNGGYEKFICRMNERAKELGLKNTSFVTPNGLDGDGHHTTAAELAKLSVEAMKNSLFREIVSSRSADIAGRSMQNHNKLLTFREDCIGVKTGFTKIAGRCLVSSFERNGREVIIVTLNAPDDWNDHMKLCDYAFSDYEECDLLCAGETVAELSVAGGEKKHVKAAAKENVRLFLSNAECSRLETKIYAKQICYAPISAGKVCGSIVYELDGVEIAASELVYSEDICQNEVKETTMLQKLQEFVAGIAERLGF